MDKYLHSSQKLSIDEKLNQALRLNEPELREFERKLRDSYVFKEQMCQIKEHEHKQTVEKIMNQRELESLKNNAAYIDEIEKQNLLEKRLIEKEYKTELQLQIELQGLQTQLRKMVHLQKNETFDQLTENIYQENFRRQNKKLELKSSTQIEIKMFHITKEISKVKEKLLIAEETRKIEEFNAEQALKKLKIDEAKKLKKNIKDAINEKIASKILEQRKAVDERERLLQELHEYEYMVKQKQKEHNNIDKNKFKEEIVKILKIQIESNKVAERKLKNEELQYREQLIKESNLDNELENEIKIKEKLKKYQYSADIDRQIYHNQKEAEFKQQMIRQGEEYLKKFHEKTKENIEREKLKIMQEYSVELKNNL